MKYFLAILAAMFFIIPTHNLRAQGRHSFNIKNDIPYSIDDIKFRSTNSVNTVQSNLYPQSGEQNLAHGPLIERMVAQQKNIPGAFLNKQAQLNSVLNKTAAPNSQIYLPDTLILYTTSDSIRISASYSQKGFNTQRLTEIRYNGHWVNYMLNTWTYLNANGNSLELKQLWYNGQWTNSTLDSSTYDTDGNMLVHLFSYWSLGVRKDSILSFRTYDANGSMLTDLGEYMTNGQWVNHDRSTYANDGSGNHLTFLFETWTNSMWTYSTQYAYTYDGSGNMLTSLNRNWYNSQWNNGTLDTYSYDGNGNVLTLVVQSWSGSWTNANKNTYTYDANGYKINWLEQSWSSEWVNTGQFTYTNNSSGKVLIMLYQNWQNSTWSDYQQSTFTYDVNGNELTGYNTKWSNSSWQPVDYNFDVNVNGSDYYFNGYAINISYILVNITGISADNSSIVNDYSLSQNYPNPFNPSTTISYRLPTQSNVTLKVFDVLGREVATLVNSVEQPGYKSVTLDARNLSSSVYYYRLQAGNHIETKKLLLLR